MPMDPYRWYLMQQAATAAGSGRNSSGIPTSSLRTGSSDVPRVPFERFPGSGGTPSRIPISDIRQTEDPTTDPLPPTSVTSPDTLVPDLPPGLGGPGSYPTPETPNLPHQAMDVPRSVSDPYAPDYVTPPAATPFTESAPNDFVTDTPNQYNPAPNETMTPEDRGYYPADQPPDYGNIMPQAPVTFPPNFWGDMTGGPVNPPPNETMYPNDQGYINYTPTDSSGFDASGEMQQPPGGDYASGGQGNFDFTAPPGQDQNQFLQDIPTDFVTDPGGTPPQESTFDFGVTDPSGISIEPGELEQPSLDEPLPPPPAAGTGMPDHLVPNIPGDPNNNLTRGGISMPLYPTKGDVFPQPSLRDELGRPTDWKGAGQFFKDAAGNIVDATGRIVQAVGDAAKGLVNNIMNDPRNTTPDYLTSLGYHQIDTGDTLSDIEHPLMLPAGVTGPTTGPADVGAYGAGGGGGSYFHGGASAGQQHGATSVAGAFYGLGGSGPTDISRFFRKYTRIPFSREQYAKLPYTLSNKGYGTWNNQAPVIPSYPDYLAAFHPVGTAGSSTGPGGAAYNYFHGGGDRQVSKPLSRGTPPTAPK